MNEPLQNGAAPNPIPPPRLGEWLRTFLLGALAMGYIQARTYDPPGHDSWYHIKMAALLPEIGFPHQFPWLRHTIFYEHFVSHHHGFHVMLVPFVHTSRWVAEHVPDRVRRWAEARSETRLLEGFKIGFRGWLKYPYVLGAKVLNCLLVGAVFVCFLRLLVYLQVRHRMIWVMALLILPTDFYMRLAFIRAPVAAMVILLLAVEAALACRYLWVGVLGFLMVHLYAGFVFFPAVVGVIALSHIITGRTWGHVKECLWLALAVAAGMAVGLLTHPYRADMPEFLAVQILQTGFQSRALNKVNVGSEWYPIKFDYWLQISAAVLVLICVSLLARLTWARLFARNHFPLLALNLFFLGLCFVSRRWIEYWPVFCLLNAAALWSGFSPRVPEFVAAWPGGAPTIRFIKQAATRTYTSLCIVILASGAFTVHQVYRSAGGKYDTPSVQAAMQWLQENTPRMSLLFADDWDVFPVFFFFNSHNAYVCGLDPQFTASMDPVLWERYCVITQGRAPAKSKVWVRDKESQEVVQEEFRVRIQDIREHFDADYIIVDSDHGPFYRDLLKHTDDFAFRYPLTSAGKPPAKQPHLAIFEVLSGVPRETPAVDGL